MKNASTIGVLTLIFGIATIYAAFSNKYDIYGLTGKLTRRFGKKTMKAFYFCGGIGLIIFSLTSLFKIQ